MTARSFLGAGKVLADIFVGGVATGNYIEFLEVGKFEIKPNSDLKEQTSKSRAQYGQIIETVAIPKPGDFTMMLREMNRDSLRLAFMASQSTLAVGSATVVDEVLIAKLGVFVPVLNKNLAAAGLVVSHTSGTPNYVLGTDYDVNYAFGLIRAIAGGAITNLQSLKVDYVANAIAGTRLLGSVTPSVRARLLFDGVNLVDNLPARVTVWEVLLTPSGAVDLMSDNWVEVTLQGRMKTPTGKTSPFEVDLLDTIEA